MSNPDDGQNSPSIAPKPTVPVPPKLTLVSSKPAAEPEWYGRLLRTGTKKRPGVPKKAMRNAAIALEHAPEFKDALTYNASALTVNIEQPLPWDSSDDFQPREWNDNDDRRFLMWLEERNIMLNLKVVCEAVQAVANQRAFHPIKAYLDSVTWDGKPRVDTWLTTYLNAEDTPFHRAVGRRWLISGVARIRHPGCQADCMLILEGKQGTRKSSALRVLGGEWFTDEIRSLGHRDTSMSLAGKWIVEFGELEAFKDDSLEKLKAFLSRRIDRFRPPYGRSVVDVKRQCLFAGTTNNRESLKDTTGNRRFWPVASGAVALEALVADRDQLWAEAQHMFNQGLPWWMETEELQTAVTSTTEEYREIDPWEELIEEYVVGKQQVTISELVDDIFEKSMAELRRSEHTKIGEFLRKFGFERKKVRVTGKGVKWQFIRVCSPT